MSRTASDDLVDFHLSRTRSLVALGRTAPVAGVGVLAVVACSALLADGAIRALALGLAWTVAIIGVVLTGVAAVRTLRPPLLVRVDPVGMQVHVLRGAGPSRVLWTDVRAVRREPLPPGPCVVVQLRDGRRCVVPESLVGEGGENLAQALRARLDSAHGQNRL